MQKIEGDEDYGVKLNDGTYETPRVPVKKARDEADAELRAENYDLSAAAHPISCVATFAFKVGAILCYFFSGLFFSKVFVFIIVTILGALDFWVVKNITGRLLVGLRWWSDFDDSGKEIWRFESYDKDFSTNAVDVAFFWTSQLAGTLVWASLLILKVLTLSAFWGLLVFINLSLCATNLYGYYQCRGQHSKKLKDLRSKGMVAVAGKLF